MLLLWRLNVNNFAFFIFLIIPSLRSLTDELKDLNWAFLISCCYFFYKYYKKYKFPVINSPLMNTLNLLQSILLLIDSLGESMINTHFIFECPKILIPLILKRLPLLFLRVELLSNTNKLRIKPGTLRRRIQLTRHNKINYCTQISSKISKTNHLPSAIKWVFVMRKW